MPVTEHFDRLPNSLVLVIFNKLGDIKSLGRCSAVSKHFNGLVPHVEDVVVKVDCVISSEESGSLSGRSRGFIGLFVKLVIGSVGNCNYKSMRFLCHHRYVSQSIC